MQEARREQLDAHAAARMKRKAVESKKVTPKMLCLRGLSPGIFSLCQASLLHANG